MSEVTTSTMPKHKIIANRILEGDATKAILMEVADVNPAGFASQLSYLRMQANAVAEVAPDAARFPLVGENGVYFMGSYDQYLEASASKSTPGKSRTRTTAEALAFAQKREDKASASMAKAQAKAKAQPDDNVYSLKAQIAELELQLASVMLAHVEQANYAYESFTIDDTKPAATLTETDADTDTDTVDSEGLI